MDELKRLGKDTEKYKKYGRVPDTEENDFYAEAIKILWIKDLSVR